MFATALSHSSSLPTSRRAIILTVWILLVSALAVGCATTGEGDRSVRSAKSFDGVDIRYEVAGRGDPALVFVHGWSCDRSYWRAQVDAFAASHTVVAIDLGGHGESGRNREHWTMDSFAADVRSVVEALGLSRIVLVGHSMGGPVIVRAAEAIPDRVSGLVPVDSFVSVPTPEVRKKAVPELVKRLRTEFRAATADVAKEFMFRPDADPALVKRIVEAMAATDPIVGASAMESYLENSDQLGATKMPVRLINSDLMPTDLAEWRRQNPGVELAVMPATGHFLMMERPEEFNALLRTAVAKMAGAAR